MSECLPRNKFDTRDCLEMCLSSMGLFESAAERYGWKTSLATAYQDIHEHWDYKIQKDSKVYRVELKAQKRLSRSDKYPQDIWATVELHSVRPNNKGWLIASKADYICFEREEKFCFYPRLELLGRVMQLIDITKYVERSRDAKYCLYQRRKTKTDIVTHVEFSKLSGICEGVWYK